MPYELSWEPRGVVVTYSGNLLHEELLERHQQIAADARFDDLRYAIVDTLPTQSLSLSRADVEEVDAFLRGPACTNPNIRVVFVATHPDVLRALADYDAMADRAFKEVVCGSAQAARDLIGAGASDFRPRGWPGP
ncbi:hypothetical protein MW290_04895 [Aquincola tertiaricarbonis]|uniref:Uncharacterized protein n=1 Tax=Aquincola tertiaricarbonis TaxID=391953 RepID=A0ABY4SA63_AQUTE|nr:hypothetical protein [Aquincola tertiaricarbonis]URI07926.1 hypothetical protein MW290_04895 [Aquincola tertiaricarbonis]